MSYYRGSAFALAATLIMAQPVLSQEIKIGLSGTFTGPNATIGIPYRNAAEIFPNRSAASPVKWILLDDATDPTTAVKNARKFMDEDKVDIVLGSTSTVTASAIIDVVRRVQDRPVRALAGADPRSQAAVDVQRAAAGADHGFGHHR